MNKCKVKFIYDTVKAEGSWDHIMATESIIYHLPLRRAAELLNKAGFEIGRTSIWMHRKENCDCYNNKEEE